MLDEKLVILAISNGGKIAENRAENVKLQAELSLALENYIRAEVELRVKTISAVPVVAVPLPKSKVTSARRDRDTVKSLFHEALKKDPNKTATALAKSLRVEHAVSKAILKELMKEGILKTNVVSGWTTYSPAPTDG